MVDVFVSYKAEDRRRVVPLVNALEADGFSVWWDAHIGGGVDWRDTIEEHLDKAKCVIVVWSKRSVAREGRFVRDEATRAQRHYTYLPVRIDKVEPPLGFGETQAIPLVGWTGDRKDVRYQAVLNAARSILAGTHRPQQAIVDKPGVGRRSVMVAGGGAAVIAAVGGWFLLKPGRAAASNSIAVLPFANLSGDPAQSYFSDGIAEELRSALARIPELKVMGRTSSEKVRDDDAPTAARKLAVDSVLTGSVRRSPTTIRINAQLVDGTDGLERWSDAYDHPAGDALDVQTEIAEKVAGALRIQLSGKQRAAMAAGGSGSPEAQDLLLKGKTAWHGNPTSDRLKQAIELFDEAIRIDPQFADAHAQKAIALLVFTQTFAANSAEHDRDVRTAEAAARKALSLSPNLPSGLVGFAIARSARFDFKGALVEYEKAFDSSSSAGDTVAEYTRFLAQVGLPEEAFEWADRAISADPLNPRAHQSRVYALFCDRKYADAIAASQKLLRWAPGRSSTLSRLGDSLLLLGKVEDARAAYAQCAPQYPSRLVGEAITAARAADRPASDQALAKLKALYGDTASYRVADVHAQRGERDLALTALAHAIAIRDPGVISLPTDPFIDPVREDDRFKALVAKLEFP